MPKGFMYILECDNDSYYCGSTIDLKRRINQHQKGEGANHTKKYLPVKLVYFEEYERIDLAFNREKQVQGWSRKKKEALIYGNRKELIPLSVAYRDKISAINLMNIQKTSNEILNQKKKGLTVSTIRKLKNLLKYLCLF